MSAVFAPEVEPAVAEINDRFPKLGPGQTYHEHGSDEPGGLPSQYYSADFWSTDKAVHDQAFYWIIKTAERLNLELVISWGRIWSWERRDEGVRPYRRDANQDGVISPSEKHSNHLHVEFNEEGYYMPSLSDIRKVIREELKANNDDAARVVLTLDGVLENNMPGASASGAHASLETFIERIAKAVKA